jgi:TonB family protein
MILINVLDNQRKEITMSGLKLLPLALLTALYVGCATFGGLGSNITPPTLIQKTALPAPPPNINSQDFNLKMELLVSKEGKVLYAQLQNSSGDPAWDSAAVKCILQWKYSPAMSDGKPVQLKISQVAHVIPTAPLMMDISEIMCATLADADSAFAALRAGEDFSTVAKKYSTAESAGKGGSLGSVDIHMYGDEIQAELKNLDPGEYTHPVEFGPNYVIYKRMPAKDM